MGDASHLSGSIGVISEYATKIRFIGSVYTSLKIMAVQCGQLQGN